MITFPYVARIMARLPGQEPVELWRTSKPLRQSDWRYWTEDLSPIWSKWVEKVIPKKQLISPRPELPEGTGSKQPSGKFSQDIWEKELAYKV